MHLLPTSATHKSPLSFNTLDASRNILVASPIKESEYIAKSIEESTKGKLVASAAVTNSFVDTRSNDYILKFLTFAAILASPHPTSMTLDPCSRISDSSFYSVRDYMIKSTGLIFHDLVYFLNYS